MGGCAGSVEVDPMLEKRNTQADLQLEKAKRSRKKEKRLLLLGPGNSGKSTFFKQLLHIHGDGFKAQHRVTPIQIHNALINQIQAICESAMSDERLAKHPLSEETMDLCEFFLDMDITNLFDTAIADKIELWWKDELIKLTFAERKNLSIVDSTHYFLEKIRDICDPGYEPTEEDILLVRVPTTGVNKNPFQITDQQGESHDIVIFDCGGQKSERSKWIRVFYDATAVLYVASLSCYDQSLYEDDSINGMTEALDLFDELCNSRWFRRTAVILFLNKLDLFREKIKAQKRPLTIAFPEYRRTTKLDLTDPSLDPEIIENEIDHAKEHIKHVFEERNAIGARQIFTHFTQATDRNNVRKVFENVEFVVLSRRVAILA